MPRQDQVLLWLTGGMCGTARDVVEGHASVAGPLHFPGYAAGHETGVTP